MSHVEYTIYFPLGLTLSSHLLDFCSFLVIAVLLLLKANYQKTQHATTEIRKSWYFHRFYVTNESNSVNCCYALHCKFLKRSQSGPFKRWNKSEMVHIFASHDSSFFFKTDKGKYFFFFLWWIFAVNFSKFYLLERLYFLASLLIICH